MTITSIKVKVVRKPTLKLKVLPNFPSNVLGTTGIIITNVGGNYIFSLDTTVFPNVTALASSAVGVTMDGGGSPIPTGYQASMQVPFACTITKATLLADAVGNFVMDVKKTTFAGYPTAASIVAAAPPTLAAAQSSQNTTLTGWTTAIASGDILEFFVTSGSITKATLSLQVIR